MRSAARLRFRVLPAFALCLLGLAGCTGAFDPYQRPGNWSQTGSVDENLAQQAADPSDLIRGHGDTDSNGVAATAAIDKALGANGAGTAAGLQTTVTPVASAATQ